MTAAKQARYRLRKQAKELLNTVAAVIHPLGEARGWSYLNLAWQFVPGGSVQPDGTGRIYPGSKASIR